MAKHLVLEGFMLRPVCHSVDLDEASIEPVSLGEQMVKLPDLGAFSETQWPVMWASLQEQFAQQVEAAPVEPPNRAARRASAPRKKAGPKST